MAPPVEGRSSRTTRVVILEKSSERRPQRVEAMIGCDCSCTIESTLKVEESCRTTRLRFEYGNERSRISLAAMDQLSGSARRIGRARPWLVQLHCANLDDKADIASKQLGHQTSESVNVIDKIQDGCLWSTTMKPFSLPRQPPFQLPVSNRIPPKGHPLLAMILRFPSWHGKVYRLPPPSYRQPTCLPCRGRNRACLGPVRFRTGEICTTRLYPHTSCH